jgi:LysM repeat protein
MLRRSLVRVILVALLLTTLSLGALSLGAAADEQLYHTVKWGQTVSSIARMYGVTVQAIVTANGLKNANFIYVGQRLLIPSPAGTFITHVVVKGETLLGIAAKYGVSVWDIARRNGIVYINYIYPGQKLTILQPSGTPAPTPAPTPKAPKVQEAIIIGSPAANITVSSPITITGWGSAFENTLAVDVLDQTGKTVGQGSAMIKADMGGVGPFTGTVALSTPISGTVPGRIQVYSISPRDGAIEHLASVAVNLSASASAVKAAASAAVTETQEAIVITAPVANANVKGTAVAVAGWGSAFENSLNVDILDQAGKAIGMGSVKISAAVGQYGPFTGTITLTTPISGTQLGRVQIYSVSPRDGAYAHLNSVTVNLQP